MHLDSICLRQEQVKNINLSLEKHETTMKQMLTSNDCSLLSKLKGIIEIISKLEQDIERTVLHGQLIDSMSFNISSERLLQQIHVLGNMGEPCKSSF